MTREEEIKQGAKYSANGTIDDELAEMYFIRGAEWADQNPRKGLWDAEKVIEFIKENVREYHKSGVFHVDDFIKDLCKAMED